MLSVCACESAQDVEKAGLVCWFCGETLTDSRPGPITPYGERGDRKALTQADTSVLRSDPIGNPHYQG